MRILVVIGFLMFEVGLSRTYAQQWGLTRDRQPSRMNMRPSRGSSMRQRARQPRPVHNRDRTDVLIARYRAILERNPAEGFAFERLLSLYREKDGNIDALLHLLEEEVQSDAQNYSSRMLLGHLYRTQNRIDEARRRYMEASQLRPETSSPLIALGRIERAFDPAASREILERALQHERDSQTRRELLRELGEIALEQEDWEGAGEYYSRLSRDADGSIYLRTEFARALAERQQYSRAISEYERVLGALRGDNRVIGPILRDLAQTQLSAGELDSAISTLERAFRIVGPGSGIRRELYDILVDVYRRTNRLADLVTRLNRARDFDAIELLGRIHDELGNEEEALSAYRRALQRNPRHLDTRVRLIQLLSRAGRMEDVITEYRALTRAAPREPRFVVELAELLMQVGRRDEALRLTDQTSRRHSREPSVHQALAELYTRWGEQERATREINALVRVDPHDPTHLIALGEQQLEQGARETALATWRRILNTGSNRAEAHAMYASVLADHDFLDEAEEHYRRAISLDEDEVEYNRGLADVLERVRTGESAGDRRERDEEAARFWTKVLEMSTDRAARREARQRVVGIWSRRNRLAAKIREWNLAFEATPSDLEAGRFLAEAHLRVRPRRVELADQVLQRIVEKEPGDTESLLTWERVKMAQGDLTGAIEVLRLLVEADPRRAPQYLQRMAEHAHALYRDQDAVQYAEDAVARAPDHAEGHRRLGDLYRARQEHELAIASYRRAIELNERLLTTYFDLAELYMAQGNAVEADRLYRRILRLSPDDDLIARAGSVLLQIHLGAGTLDQLEQDMLSLALAYPGRSVFRRLVVELYDSMVSSRIQEIQAGESQENEARETLKQIGIRAVKPLLEALADRDPVQQQIAIDILGYLGNQNAAGPLLAFVESVDNPLEMRVLALRAAGGLGGSELTPRFLELARGSEGRLRGPAAWALSKIEARTSVAALRNLLEEPDPEVRVHAIVGLGKANVQSLAGRFERILRDDQSLAVRIAAVWALGRIGGDEHIPALVDTLGQGGLMSQMAAHALGRLSVRIEDRRARSALMRMLFEPNAELRSAVANALRISPQVQTELPVLGGDISLYLRRLIEGEREGGLHLDSNCSELEEAARSSLRGPVERTVIVLQILSAADESLMGARFGALSDSDRQCLLELSRALIPELERAMEHAQPLVRVLAFQLLAEASPSHFGAILELALRDENERVLRIALDVVRANHVHQEGIAEHVIRLATVHSDWSTRVRAVQALARLQSAEEILIRILRTDEYAFVREAAAMALDDSVSSSAQEALMQSLDDSDARVRQTVQQILETPASN